MKGTSRSYGNIRSKNGNIKSIMKTVLRKQQKSEKREKSENEQSSKIGVKEG